MTPPQHSPYADSGATRASPPRSQTDAIAWEEPERQLSFQSWLGNVASAQGLDPSTLRLASADASFRRYFRIDDFAGERSCIIMDAPPAREDSAPFVKVAGLMAQAGLRAPEVLSWDESAGFMLLSDLGHQTMMAAIKEQPELEGLPQAGQTIHALYMRAVDALITWQLASRPDVLPAYDDALLSRELALFPDWYIAKHRNIAIDSAMQDKLDGFFRLIKDSNLNSLDRARVFVHRDFMPRNLMVGPEGTGLGLGVLDFQDAVYGPITYDIASLMRDAFLSWDEEFVLDITVRYWQKARKAGLPVGDDFGEFYRAVEWMGLQRHLKVLGIFARLTLRDGKPQYLADTPRFMKYARSTASRYRQLGPLMVLLDEIEGNETRVGYTF
ncbi:MAG: phosphotransferase [Pseudomonadota bacterium]